MISIHLHRFFLENIGHMYDFEGGGVVPGRVWGRVSISKEKKFNWILIHIYLQLMLYYLSNQMHSNPFHMTKHIHQIDKLIIKKNVPNDTASSQVVSLILENAVSFGTVWIFQTGPISAHSVNVRCWHCFSFCKLN